MIFQNHSRQPLFFAYFKKKRSIIPKKQLIFFMRLKMLRSFLAEPPKNQKMRIRF